MAIVVVTETPEHAVELFDWAWRLAQARGESLTVIALESGRPELAQAIDLRGELAPDIAPVLRALRAEAEAHPEPFDDDPETPPLFVRQVRTAQPGRRVIEEADRVDASLVIVRGRRSNETVDTTLGQHLYVHCHRALMVVTGSADEMPRRILVPTAEGCHTGEALKAAHGIVSESLGEVTALYLELEKDGEQHGEQILTDALNDAKLSQAERVVRRVDAAKTLAEGINAAKIDHDAVFYGAPRRGDPSKSLLELVPEDLVTESDGRLVAVLRAERTPVERFIEAFDRMVHLWVPQMKRQQRKEIYSQLEEQSEWGFDFKMLMALSTCIASFGLIQNSTAVVIGAMLVAPLMTPMLCAGMALQQGNQQLLKNNAKAITAGFTTAVSVAFIVGLLSPIRVPTEEMMGRGVPTLLDLGVALVSGFAAAYAFSRGEKLAAMLPGVAIAAALVPPIATTGICLSLVASTGVWALFGTTQTTIAGDAALMGAGAALLFFTNVVAIILGASIAFYSFGIRRWDPEPWVKRVTQGLVITVFVLAIPLSAILWGVMKKTSPGLTAELQTVVSQYDAYRFKSLQWVDERLEVYLRGPSAPSSDLVSDIRRHAVRRHGSDVVVHVVTEMTIESRADTPGAEYLGTVTKKVRALVAQSASYRLVDLTKAGGLVEVTLSGSRPPTAELIEQIKTVVQDRFGLEISVRIKLQWTFESPARDDRREAE